MNGHIDSRRERKIAEPLSRRFTVVAPDLRGYGFSSKPPDGDNHSGYSKRAMALDQVEVMRALGFERFAVVGHDRGGRVTWRLAVEQPQHVSRAIVLDIVPTYGPVTREFATAYFHWFFLTQPAPFPEQLIEAAPEAFLRRFLSRAGITSEAFAEYLRASREPGGACREGTTCPKNVPSKRYRRSSSSSWRSSVANASITASS